MTQDEAEHDEGDELRRVRLRRSDADLRAGVDVDAAVRLAGDGAADGVGDAQDQAAARLAIPEKPGTGKADNFKKERADSNTFQWHRRSQVLTGCLINNRAKIRL